MSWTCPSCQRVFGRTRQSHECSPAMTLDEYFSTGPPFERPVFDAVVEFLETLGPMHVEPVSVGIFIKPGRSFVELRPLTKWVQLGYPGPKGWSKFRLHGPDDLTDEVKDALTEAYERVIGSA